MLKMLEHCRFSIYIWCFCPVDVCFPGGGWFLGWSWESLLLTTGHWACCAETHPLCVEPCTIYEFALQQWAGRKLG